MERSRAVSGRNIGGLVLDGHAQRHARSFDRTAARRRRGDRRSRRGGARRRDRLFCARMRVHARLRSAMRCHARRPSGGDARRQPSRSRGDALCRRVRPYARRRRLDWRNPIFCHSLGANAGGRAASGRGALLSDVACLGRPADRRRRVHGGRFMSASPRRFTEPPMASCFAPRSRCWAACCFLAA